MKLKTKGAEKEEITVHEFIGVKGFKAKGKRISLHAVKKIELLEPLEEMKNEELKIKNEERTVTSEEVKSEKGKMKNEKGRIKNEKGKVKVKSDEEPTGDKKNEDTGDTVQMELPL